MNLDNMQGYTGSELVKLIKINGGIIEPEPDKTPIGFIHAPSEEDRIIDTSPFERTCPECGHRWISKACPIACPECKQPFMDGSCG